MLGISTDLCLRPPIAWWPDEATFAADFVGRRFMRHAASVPANAAYSVTRPGIAWSDDLTEHAPDTPRLGVDGLLLEETRQRLSSFPAEPASWTFLSGMPTITALPDTPPFAPARIGSDGNIFARANLAQQSFISGQHVALRVRYHAGTSGRLGVYMRDEASGMQSILDGPIGAIIAQSSGGGTWSNIVNVDLGGGFYEITATIAVSTTSTDWRMGVSPRSTVIGADVEILGAMNELRDQAGSWILGAASQPAEQLVLHLPEGGQELEILLADGTRLSFASPGGDHVLTADGIGFSGMHLVIAGIVATAA